MSFALVLAVLETLREKSCGTEMWWGLICLMVGTALCIYPTLCFRWGTTINIFENHASVALRAYNVAVSLVGARISLKTAFPLYWGLSERDVECGTQKSDCKISIVSPSGCNEWLFQHFISNETVVMHFVKIVNIWYIWIKKHHFPDAECG